MLNIIICALVIGFCNAIPIPNPLAPAIPGALTTTHHHHTATAHHPHHPVGLGYGYGGLGAGYPGVVKHTETVSSAAGYHGAAGAALNPYSAYGAYPGLAGLGYGSMYTYPAAKQYTQVTTTALRPSVYGYY